MPKLSKKIKRRIKAKKLKHPAVEVRSARRETRSYRTAGLSVRKAANGSMELVGTAIVFDSPSQDLGGFTEVVKYQAVQSSLQRNNDLYLLWQHDSSQPLSRTKTGSLKLTLTRGGLDFVATLPNSPLGQNAYQAVADGTVDSVSFGFECLDDKWIVGQDGSSVVRELWDINVGEISPVTWAAYLAPHVDTRSCPATLRSKLNLRNEGDLDDDENDDDTEDQDGCGCDCEACLDDRCEECSATDCDSDECSDCPMQTRAAHLELILRRLKS